jgi:hypothetical protein
VKAGRRYKFSLAIAKRERCKVLQSDAKGLADGTV